jgi:hypothetical protein
VTIRGGPAQEVVESRVENVGGRRGEGNRRNQAARRTVRGRCEQTLILAEAEKRFWQGESEGEVAERRRRSRVTSSEEPRCRQARRAPFTLAEARVYARQPTTRMQAGGC